MPADADRVTPRRSALWSALSLFSLLVLMLGFIVHAADFGWRGLTRDLAGESYLFGGPPLSDVALSIHMLCGAAITTLAPLQVFSGLRRRWPTLHRIGGRIFAGLAVVTASGGLIFIALRGTIGGAWMDFGFALYGALVLLATARTIGHARAGRFVRHRDWALRLFVLAIASWLFRLHYALWYLATDGAWSNDALTGPFDRVQVLAFFLPYLALLEVALRRGWIRRDFPGGRHSR